MTPRWIRKTGRAAEHALDSLIEGRFVFWLGALWGQWEAKLHHTHSGLTVAEWALAAVGALMLLAPLVRMVMRRRQRAVLDDASDVGLLSGVVSINQLRLQAGEDR